MGATLKSGEAAERLVWAEGAGRHIAAPLNALERNGGSVEREETHSALVMLGRLRRTAAAAGYRAETAGRTAASGKITAAGEGLLPDLDAAVQRDSRRYDGGFELF